MKNYRGIAGFTLIETIVALGLSSVVAVALFSMYFCVCSTFKYQLVSTDVQYAERTAMQMIIEDILTAKKVEYLDDGCKLRLLINDDKVSYYLQNQIVYRHGAAKMPVANDISCLSFQPGYRAGYTVIVIEAENSYDNKRLVCSVMPRLLWRSMPARADADV